MKKTRVEIKMTFSADLDPIKGWGNQPDDWCTMLEQRIGATSGGPYNMKLVITDLNCRDVAEQIETGDGPVRYRRMTITDEMVEAGARAIAPEVWANDGAIFGHPDSLNRRGHELCKNTVRAQAAACLTAALSSQDGATR